MLKAVVKLAVLVAVLWFGAIPPDLAHAQMRMGPLSKEAIKNVPALRQTKICEGCDLAGANLRSFELQNGNLKNADLTNSTIQFSDLTNATLEGANPLQFSYRRHDCNGSKFL